MRARILERVAVDLPSIPPLILRRTRRRLIKATLGDIGLDITPLHFEIMRLLEEEGTLHLTELGESLQVAKAQMTQLIDRLVDLRIVVREIDAEDRRIFNITLTDHGRSVMDEQKARLVRQVMESMAALTDKELDELSNHLRALRDILFRLL